MIFISFLLCFTLALANEDGGQHDSVISPDLQKKMQAMVDSNPMQIIGTINKDSDPKEIRSVVGMLSKKLHHLEAERDAIQRRQKEMADKEAAEKAEKIKMESEKSQKIIAAKKETSDLSGLLGLISKMAPAPVTHEAPEPSKTQKGTSDIIGLLSALQPKPQKKDAKSVDNGKSATILALLPLLLKGLAA